MKKLPISALAPVASLSHPLYHKSGYCLYNVREALLRAHIQAMRECGITEVYQVQAGDAALDFERQARMREVPVDELTHADILAAPINGPDGALLARRGQGINDRLLDLLSAHDVETVMAERYAGAHGIVEAFLERKREISVRQLHQRSLAEKLRNIKMLLSAENVTEESVNKSLHGDLQDQPSGAALEHCVERVDPRVARETDIKAKYQHTYEEAMAMAREALTVLRSGGRYDAARVGRQLGELVRLLVQDRDLFLALHLLRSRDAYLYRHSLHVALLSINVATTLGYSEEQVLEIGYCALLSDIGMLKVPASAMEHGGPLSPEQLEEVRRHPRHSLAIVRSMSNLPRTVPLVAYQVHERSDGSGYPRGTLSERIHRFAKIVSVADAYDAMISQRPHRPAMQPYAAMEHILRDVQAGKFDASVVRGFLRFLSLFPVGSWVRLSDGCYGRVSSANAEHFTKPVVRVLLDAHKRPVRQHEVLDLSATDQVRIESAVSDKDMGGSPLDAL